MSFVKTYQNIYITNILLTLAKGIDATITFTVAHQRGFVIARSEVTWQSHPILPT